MPQAFRRLGRPHRSCRRPDAPATRGLRDLARGLFRHALGTVLLMAAVLPIGISARPVKALIDVERTAAQKAELPQAAQADTTRPGTVHPNAVPYETDRSVAYHILAAPAYVLHGVTRPIGWGVKYVERRFPELFEPKQPPRGVLPLLEIGGPAGFLVGGALYDNQLFGSTHRARLEGLYGASDTFELQGEYQAPGLFGDNTELAFVANFFSQPEDEFFLGGNSSAPSDESQFFREQFDATLRAAYRPGPLEVSVDLLFEHVEAQEDTSTLGQRLIDANPPGFDQTLNSLTPRATLTLDFTRGAPRTHAGTKLSLQADYTHDLEGERFRYGRYVAQVEQYLPVAIFPNSRRLALRARLEQVEPLFEGEAVPFYQLPRLGGSRTLRGYRFDRFRGDGSVLFSAEYRYPIWRLWDAVLFADGGQVFESFDQVAVSEFQWSYGGGIHLLSPKGLTFRFEVAHSEEGLQAILTVDPSFKTTAR